MKAGASARWPLPWRSDSRCPSIPRISENARCGGGLTGSPAASISRPSRRSSSPGSMRAARPASAGGSGWAKPSASAGRSANAGSPRCRETWPGAA
jgi:hypothetical protein